MTDLFDGITARAVIGPQFAGPDQTGKARTDHPDTAHAAATRAAPGSGKKRQQVYAAIRHGGPGGRTDEQIQIELGMNPSTQRPRRVELVEKGLVADSGQRRKTTSGRMAIVWVTL